MAAAKKLVKKDAGGKITRSGIDFGLYGWILEQQLAEQDALLAEPNNGRSGRATKLIFDQTPGQNWLNFLKQLQDAGVGRSVGRQSGTTNGTTLTANFSKGDAAMIVESIAGLRNYINQSTSAGGKVDVGVGYLPKPDGAKGGVIIGGASVWITTQGSAADQAGAWEMVKFLAQPDSQAFFASNTGYYPTRKASYNEQTMKDALTKYPQFQVAIDQLHNSPASPATAGAVFGSFSGSRQNVEAAMEQYMNGNSPSAQQALGDAAKKENDRLEEYNSTVK
jgi:sn-glycerol 3-phosphate transport system substrate-binding protein